MEAKMSSWPYEQPCRRFSLYEILSATQNFDKALVIGKGGFGKVYKAIMRVENGEIVTVAIKRLDSSSNQGAPEFWAEIEMLSKLRHFNLVSLFGYCNENSEMILIYEYMPNGTLDGNLHKNGTRTRSLSWVQRLKISIGVAQGLHYLHTGTGTQHGVIHRDVKSSNILLDENDAAKISDFGLSKLGPITASGSYVNTLIRGTFGYLDPEYFLTGRLTTKSDVFAFGVVLFELLCGRPALNNSLDEDRCSLAKWAPESIEKRKLNEIIDNNIKTQICSKTLKVYVQIADLCLSSESKKRPSMAEIMGALGRCLSQQKKYDIQVTQAASKVTRNRMIKWPFISPKVNSAQSTSKPSKNNGDTIEHSSPSIENREDHHQIVEDQREVVFFGKMLDRLLHDAAQTKTKSPDKDNINHGSSSKHHSYDHHEVSPQILVKELKMFTFSELNEATGDFGLHMMLGEGKFGQVYNGWLKKNEDFHYGSNNRLRIAVKKVHNFQVSQLLMRKFIDLRILNKLNHVNIIKPLGYCFEDKNLYLVYEFMENGNLDAHLYSKNKTPMELKTRIQIAEGIAKALSFLNRTEDQVTYYPFRLHQVLLDQNFNPKLSDYDVAKLVDEDSYKSVVDPLFYSPVQISTSNIKGDVHAFGVGVIQLITGEKNYESSYANLRQKLQSSEDFRRAMDPRMPNVDATIVNVARMLSCIAFLCLDNRYFTLDMALKDLRKIVARMRKYKPN